MEGIVRALRWGGTQVLNTASVFTFTWLLRETIVAAQAAVVDGASSVKMRVVFPVRESDVRQYSGLKGFVIT